MSIEEQVTEELERQLVGFDKEYPTVESLYNFDYDNNEMLYKPEVFEVYVEIFNKLSNECIH